MLLYFETGGENMEKSARFELRISPEDKRMLQDAAASMGMTLAEFLLYAGKRQSNELVGYNIFRIDSV